MNIPLTEVQQKTMERAGFTEAQQPRIENMVNTIKARIKQAPKGMPPRSILRVWVKALESGKYRQGSGQLKTLALFTDTKKKNYEYCCLGVLGQVCGVRHGSLIRERNSFLTAQACEKVGMNDGTFKTGLGYTNEGTMQSMFASFNDSNGATFPEIAMALRIACNV